MKTVKEYRKIGMPSLEEIKAKLHSKTITNTMKEFNDGQELKLENGFSLDSLSDLGKGLSISHKSSCGDIH